MAAIDKTYLYKWVDYKALHDWCKSVGTIIDDYGNEITPLDWIWELTEDEFNSNISHQIARSIEAYNRGDYKSAVDEGLMTQDEYDNWDAIKHIWGIPVWNTSIAFDVWLIRNCPLDFIQDRLKEQYGGGWSKQTFTNHNDDSMYYQILNRNSPYDTYKRNGLGRGIHVNKKAFPVYSMPNGFRTFYYVSIRFPDDSHVWYEEDKDFWKSRDDLSNDGNCSSSCCVIEGNKKFKYLFRRLQKWDLPKGSVVTFDFCATHKKKKCRFHDRFSIVIGEKRKR